MRRKYVWDVSRETARKRCPWAAVIARVRGGWICFESVSDYQTWRAQR